MTEEQDVVTEEHDVVPRAPTIGRILADLATTGTTSCDIGPSTVDRPALTEPAREPSWLV